MNTADDRAAAPATTSCPVPWCDQPGPHPWEKWGGVEYENPANQDWERMHAHACTGEELKLAFYEYADAAGQSIDAVGVGIRYIDIAALDPQQDINTAAELTVGLREAVTIAVADGIQEQSPPINRVLAEQELLAAVAEWCRGIAPQGRVSAACVRLAAATAEVAGTEVVR